MLAIDIAKRLGDFTLEAAFTSETRVTALFGPSGSGKTTLLSIVAGLIRPDRGRVIVEDRVLHDSAARIDVPAHRRRIGYVFQDARLFPHLSVGQNLAFGRVMNRLPRDRDEEARILALLGIGDLLKRRPGGLSGGERQRVAIGRALFARPSLLLLDEPLASLDQARKAEIMPYLLRLRDEGRVPMLYVSHDADEVARIAATIVRLENGRVRAVERL